jgi:hypothetical protein
MALLEDIFKGGAEGIFGGIAKIIGLFKADPNIAATSAATIAAAEAQLRQAELDYELKLSLAQTEIDKIEAGSSDKFTSRWRPFVGWTCGVSLGFSTMGVPLLTWLSASIAAGKMQPVPTPDNGLLITILVAMLGVGGMRSFDKLNGTARK